MVRKNLLTRNLPWVGLEEIHKICYKILPSSWCRWCWFYPEMLGCSSSLESPTLSVETQLIIIHDRGGENIQLTYGIEGFLIFLVSPVNELNRVGKARVLPGRHHLVVDLSIDPAFFKISSTTSIVASISISWLVALFCWRCFIFSKRGCCCALRKDGGYHDKGNNFGNCNWKGILWWVEVLIFAWMFFWKFALKILC